MKQDKTITANTHQTKQADEKDGTTEMVNMKLFSDSSSALVTTQKSGVGRMKHIEIRHLYLQELLRRKVISVEKINTKQNPADLETKKLAVERG